MNEGEKDMYIRKMKEKYISDPKSFDQMEDEEILHSISNTTMDCTLTAKLSPLYYIMI